MLRYWNVLTNVVCILPFYYGIQMSRPVEATIWLCTGITSSVYHLFETGILEASEDSGLFMGLRTGDYLMSHLSIAAVLYLLAIPHTNLRHSLLFALCPSLLIMIESEFPMYKQHIPIIVYFLIGYSGYFMVLRDRCIEKYESIRWSYIYFGFLCNIIQWTFYRILSQKYSDYYNFFHGMHHIMAFISILFYINSINFKRFPRIESSADIWVSQEHEIQRMIPIEPPVSIISHRRTGSKDY